MSQLNQIVDVQISVESARITRASFGAALLLTKTALFSDAVKAYTSLAEMVDDGFLDSSAAYKAAADYFSQENGAATLYVGRRGATHIITVTVADDFTYIIPIGGVSYQYTSDSDASMAEIRTGLKEAINAATSVHGFVAADVSTNQISLTPQAGKAGAFVGTLSANLAVTSVTYGRTIAQDLDACQESNSEWYGIVLVDRNNDDAVAVAEWVASAAAPHVFAYASDDAAIINSAEETTSIAYDFKDVGYRRSWVMYYSLAATRYPEAALFSKILAQDPGSYTVKFQTLDNMPADSLTDSQCSVAKAKNAMVFIPVAGRRMVQEGVTAEGEYIDVIIGIDWNTADIQEGVFGLLVSSPKVPYTNAGITSVEAVVRERVQNAVDAGLYTDVPAPTFSVPDANTVSSGDKAARRLRNVKFTATLAGAIHFVEVRGTVSV